MKLPPQPSADQALRAENAELRARLKEAEETLCAIRDGEVDALVVESDTGPQIFLLQGLEAEQNRIRGEMLAQVSDAVVGTDTEDRITFLNGAAERRYGVRAGDVLGCELTGIYTRLWPTPEAEAAKLTALRERGEWRGELIHRTRDGRELDVEASVATLRGSDGERKGMVAAIRDITERKRLEDEKAEAMRLLETLLAHAPVGFAYFDRELRFVRINERLAEINGYSVEAHLGRRVAEILPTLATSLREVAASILATGQPVLDHEFTGETARAPGVLRSWNGSWYPVHDERGEIVGFGAVVEEITVRKKAETALRRNTALFSQIIEQAPGGVYVVDAQFRVAHMNAESLPSFASAMPLIGRDFDEVLEIVWGPEVGPQIASIFRHTLATGERHVSERFNESRQDLGVEQAFEWETHRITMPDGQHGVVCYFQDVTARQHAEAALRLLNERFDLAVKCSHAMLWQQDLDLCFTWLYNPAPSIDCSDAVGKRDEDLFERSEDAAVIVALKREVIRSGVGVRQEFCPHMQGVGHCFELLMEPLRDAAGVITGLTGAAIDITERKRVEEALRHNERRFRGIFDSAFQFIGLMTPDGTLIEANRTALEGGGLRAQNVIGKPFWECDWWTLTERTGRELRTAIGRAASGELVRYNVDVRGAEGQVVTLDFSIKPIRDHAGRVVLLVPEGRDITDLKRIEENLRLTNQRFDLAVKCSQVFLWQQDLELRFTWLYNPAQGIDSSDAVGKRDEDLLDRAEDAAVIVALKREVIRSGVGVRQEFFPHIQGVRRCFEVLMEPLRDAVGLITGLTGAAIDITERKRAEEQLRRLAAKLSETDRHKDEFLATLAHELRNPLAPIRTNLHLMKLAGGNPDVVMKSVGVMERQVSHMTHLIDDLLDLARINGGKIVLKRERLSVADVVQDAVAISRPAIEEHGHELIAHAPLEPVYVDADRTRLTQVFGNLLNNAAKYTDPGGRIRVAFERHGGEVVVAVEDNGVGISAQMLSRVFDLFAQVDRSIEKSQGGLGIGLNISQRLAEMHGGSIVAESGGLGAGSRFVVRLPIALSPEAEHCDQSVESVKAATAGHRILVVDDNRDAAQSLSLLLKFMGNELRTAHDGLEALDLAAEFRPELVLLDIGMPRLNGYDTARRIREQPWGKGMVLVALSGWGQEEDKRKSKEAGFDGHLVKPVDIAALDKLLGELKTPVVSP